eukprot:scaffold229612_cov28-Tisochrysis_lutea.AAC.1
MQKALRHPAATEYWPWHTGVPEYPEERAHGRGLGQLAQGGRQAAAAHLQPSSACRPEPHESPWAKALNPAPQAASTLDCQD